MELTSLQLNHFKCFKSVCVLFTVLFYHSFSSPLVKRWPWYLDWKVKGRFFISYFLFLRSFVSSFFIFFIFFFILPHKRSFFYRSLVRSSLVRSCFRSFVSSFVRLFVHFFFHLFILSFFLFFVLSFFRQSIEIKIQSGKIKTSWK